MAAMVEAPFIIGTEKKSEALRGASPAEMRVSRQLDTLQRMADQERDQRWGPNWVSEMKDFYELNYYPSTATPSYRPRIVLPELQYLLMSESTDLTNDSPKCYISVNGKRDEPREPITTREVTKRGGADRYERDVAEGNLTRGPDQQIE